MGCPTAEREKEALDALVSNIAECGNHLHVGFVGWRYLCETLIKYGRADLAWEIINKRDQPSIGWWIEQGAVTFWEQWDGGFSRNIRMSFADCGSDCILGMMSPLILEGICFTTNIPLPFQPFL